MNKLLLVSFIFINLMFGQKNRSLNQPSIDTREKINTVDALATTVPRILSYQGLLTQPNGRAIKDGNIQVTFRLYTELDGGSHFWEESQEIFIEDGIITATLGKLIAIESVPSASFLEVEINGTALAPRQEMASSFYAVISDTAKFSQGGNYTDLDGLPDLTIFAKNDTLSSYPLSDSLSFVSFTGEYSDLNNLPDLSGVTQSDTLNFYVMTDSLSNYTLTSNLTPVAISNSYNDLIDLPDLSLYTPLDTLTNYVNVDTLSEYVLNNDLGNLSLQDSANVAITGGSITGVNDISIDDGGTGASDVSTARSNLGLEIGIDIQGYDSDVNDLADGTLSASRVQYLENVTSDIQEQLNDIGEGPINSLQDLGVSADSTELNYVDGVTSEIQTQLDNKQGLNSNLTTLTTLAQNDGNIIVSDGTSWTAENGADARSSLGLGSLATQASDDVLITGGTVSNITDISVGDGGTGASDITSARSNLGLELGVDVQVYDADLTDLADGTLSAEKVEYLETVTSDVQTQLDSKGTGTVSTLLDLGITAEDTELNYVDGVTSDIQTQFNSKQDINSTLTDILGIAHSDGTLIISDGTNWVPESGATARASLGLGSVSTQASDDVSISGGRVTGIIDLAIGDGGTGASDVSSARSNLGLEIGVDVQGYDGDLADLADGTLSASKVENNEYFITSPGTAGEAWISDGAGAGSWGDATGITGAASTIDTEDLTAKRAVISNINGKIDVSVTSSTELAFLDGVTSSVQPQLDDKQTLDSDLTDLAALSQGDGNLIVSDGTNWTVENGSDARATLGLGSVATQDAGSIVLTGGTISGITDIAIDDGGTGASDVSTARSNLGVELGVDVQAYDADLADLADGELSANKVENNEYFISSAGSSSEIWTSDGSGAGAWVAASASLTGAGSTIDTEDLTSSVAMVTDSNGKVAVSTVTATELGYASGVTSNIQTQLDTKGTVNTLLDLSVTSSAAELNILTGVTSNAGELNYVDGVTSSIQTQLDGKQASVSGSATTIDTETLTASLAMVTDSNGKVAVSAVTATELGYASGVTSNIQTQLNAKGTVSTLSDLSVTSTATELNILDGVTATTAELNINDGGTSATSTTIADADRLVLNDNGTLVQVAVTDLSTYIDSKGKLIPVIESSQTGYRFSTADATKHGDIGTDAVDMSSSNSSSNTKGATGDYSTAMGQNTTASGSQSIAMGQNTIASGGRSFATGSATTASGSQSIAMGYGSQASGGNSTATGRSATASGYASTAMGQNTTASGSASIAMGQYTTASDFGSLVTGKYNSVGSSVTAGGSATDFDNDNSAFVIGNGTASGSESDALVVYSSGNATLGGDLTITGNDITFGNAETISNSTNGTVAITATTTSLSGDLTVTGNDITFGNSETISNSTNGTVVVTATTTSLSGDLTVTGNDITFGNSETISNSINGTVAVTATTTSLSGDLTVTGNDITFGNGETLSNATDGTIVANTTNFVVGAGNANGIVASSGDYDLILATGNSTTGNISITDGADQNITISPNGTGKTDFDDNPITGFGADLQTLSGTSKTLAASDNGTVIVCSSGSATTLTVPTGLPAGFNCMIVQAGSGQVTLSASSTTLNNRNGLKTAAQYAMMTLVNYATNTFVVSGDTVN